MKEVPFDIARQKMLDILVDVSSFCDEHNLVYFLGYGTLIGAIRHKGFIPWDDDIDIEMPRPDYERFLTLYRASGKYSLIRPEDKGCCFLWSKIYDDETIKVEKGIDYSICPHLGIDIDIFPLDGQPDSNHFEEFKVATNKRIQLYKKISSCYRPYSGLPLLNKMYTFIWRIYGADRLKKQYLISAQQFDYSNSSMVGFNSPLSKYKNRHRKETYRLRTKVLFENHLFWAPIGYDEILSDIYGDYMQLPPEEKQITHHKNNVYWK